MPDLVSLLYVSRAAPHFRPEELPGLLERASARNRALGITGVLLCYAGRFLQVLEGPPDQVEQCFARICADARHLSVVPLARTPLTERRFPQWHMRSLQPAQGADRAVGAFLDSLEAGATPADCEDAVQLLQAMTRGR